MSKVDFEHLDGQSSVASDRNGRLGKLALPVLLLVGAGVLAYVNWPAGPQTSNLTEGTGETFETSNTSIREFPDEPVKQAADPNLVQIPVEEKKPVDSAAVDVTVNPGDDLEKLRQIEEERRRAEEERLRAEEARRRAEEDARLAALEAKRREDEEKARWERLRSEQIIVDGSGRESLAAGDPSVTIADDGQLVAVPGAESDANKAFLAQSEKQTAGIVKATRFDRTDALVAQGTMIRGFLETAINTDLPGMCAPSCARTSVRSMALASSFRRAPA
ncbi:type IV secretory pathway VirB10-like protein [Shinella sp. BE166]|uniref:hypothetical protein n=1 Tax=Shinella sp. BE166 TaxID=3373918 RepID=UPI003EBFECB8